MEDDYTFKHPPTIKEELNELKIEPKYFNTFYVHLKKDRQLPSQDIVSEVPKEQYQTIVNYLTEKKVLDTSGTVQVRMLEAFDALRNLEELLGDGENTSSKIESKGGLMPCRSSTSNYGGSNGGVLPCRDD